MREHLLELRRRLMWSAGCVLLTTVVAFAFHRQILRLLMEPAQGFDALPNGKPIYIDLTEFIGTAMKASLLVGLFASLPFVLYQIVMFVAPGLTPRERRYLYALMPASLLAFAAGAAFGYFILIPPMVEFLLNFGGDIASAQIRISSYISLMLTLLLWMGIVFETPIVLFFLSKIASAQIRISSYISLMLTLLLWMGIVFETPIVLFFLSKIGIVTPEFLVDIYRAYLVVTDGRKRLRERPRADGVGSAGMPSSPRSSSARR